jgi:hypothetical protein
VVKGIEIDWKTTLLYTRLLTALIRKISPSGKKTGIRASEGRGLRSIFGPTGDRM